MSNSRVGATRAAARNAVFFARVLPIPSRPVDWVTRRPRVGRVTYPTPAGAAEGDLYLPGGRGPHPGMVVGLGVVPFGVDHPQVPRLGAALARSGFAALLHWSPAMREYRLDPADVPTIARTYAGLIARPDIDPARSGLLGTCVGGSFALMAAADPEIRDRVGFVAAFAPYASMHSFALDIASHTREGAHGREPWAVDSLTWKVFVHSLTAGLPGAEADALREAGADSSCTADAGALSPDGRAIARVLAATGFDDAAAALSDLPAAAQARLTALSPVGYLAEVRAPLITFGHDRNDGVIPVAESRELQRALAGRAGVRYTEFDFFRHVAPRLLPPVPPAREVGKFLRFTYPIFRQATAHRDP